MLDRPVRRRDGQTGARSFWRRAGQICRAWGSEALDALLALTAPDAALHNRSRADVGRRPSLRWRSPESQARARATAIAGGRSCRKRRLADRARAALESVASPGIGALRSRSVRR